MAGFIGPKDIFRNPESLFRLIAGTFKIKDKSSLLDTAKETVKKGKEVSVLTSEGKLIQAGGDLQTVMKKVLDAEDAEVVGKYPVTEDAFSTCTPQT